MKISVVMTTYNGSTFIQEQLQSIFDQSRKADEVIICDDCSTDNTVAIIREFINEHDLTTWKVFINEVNKGWKKNFIESLGYASGDIIFFSDQDDIWYPHKIQVMSDLMNKNKRIHCLAGEFNRIDKSGNKIDEYSRTAYEGEAYTIQHVVPLEQFNTLTLLGCTMCISEMLGRLIYKLHVVDFSHDAQACRLGVLLGGACKVDLPVIQYRMHDNNTSGVVVDVKEGASTCSKRIDTIKENIVWLEKVLLYFTEKESADELIGVIKNTILMQEKRLEFLADKRILQFIRLIKYKKYYSGMSMYLGDFVYAYNLNKMVSKIIVKIKRRYNIRRK